MRKRRCRFDHIGKVTILISILGCTTAAAPSDNPESAPLKQVVDVPLPGPAVRFDYQSLDASHGRLYIAHMNVGQMKEDGWNVSQCEFSSALCSGERI
jgi:hypothetical protein